MSDPPAAWQDRYPIPHRVGQASRLSIKMNATCDIKFKLLSLIMPTCRHSGAFYKCFKRYRDALFFALSFQPNPDKPGKLIA
jgi:hypothetical protein